MVVWPILSSLIMICILIVPGVFFKKKNILTEDQNGAINSIVVNLTWPCLVIDAMQMKFSLQVLKDSAYILVVCLLILAIIFAISFPVAKLIKLPKTKQYLTVFMLLFGNTGFIGIPVIKALFGTDAVFYAAIVELINDILIFTVGILLIQLSAGANLKVGFKQFINPGLIGVIIGLVLFLLNIHLPNLIGGSIEMIGNATTPLTMFCIGFQIGGLKFKEIAGDFQVYAICFVKLLIVPVLTLLVVKLWAGDFSMLEKVLIIGFAMPVGAVASIFSQQYKGEAAFATKSVLLSTVLSLITIPIFVPIATAAGFDACYFLTMMAIIMQTAFLSPPMAASIFYFQGVAKDRITTAETIHGIWPFMALQVLVFVLCILFPQIVTWLPGHMIG